MVALGTATGAATATAASSLSKVSTLSGDYPSTYTLDAALTVPTAVLVPASLSPRLRHARRVSKVYPVPAVILGRPFIAPIPSAPLYVYEPTGVSKRSQDDGSVMWLNTFADTSQLGLESDQAGRVWIVNDSTLRAFASDSSQHVANTYIGAIGRSGPGVGRQAVLVPTSDSAVGGKAYSYPEGSFLWNAPNTGFSAFSAAADADGYLYLAYGGGSSPTRKLDPVTGGTVWTVTTGNNRAIAISPTHLFVYHRSPTTVKKMNLSNGAVVDSVAVPTTDNISIGLKTNGAIALYTVHKTSNVVYRRLADDMSLDLTLNITSPSFCAPRPDGGFYISHSSGITLYDDSGGALFTFGPSSVAGLAYAGGALGAWPESWGI